MSRKPPEALVPQEVATEIEQIVARTQRSAAFVALRALRAAPATLPAVPAGPRVALALAAADDDPPGLAGKLTEAAGKRPLGDALASAWLATRARFTEWAAREENLRAVERADDLDTGLADATHPEATPARLAALASSPYPRVRALVAAHPAAPAEALAALAADREPYVREAVARRTT